MLIFLESTIYKNDVNCFYAEFNSKPQNLKEKKFQQD